jgi:DNA polymerase-3 subunit beta
MEFQIRVPELAKALARVQGVVEKKTTMPILSHVLIKSNGKDAITVSATDLEIGLTANYEAKVVKAGAMTVGAKALFDIVRQLPEQVVSLRAEANQWVNITCGKVKFRIPGMAPESFPSLPRFDDVAFFPVDPKVLRLMIDMVLPSVCVDETRYNLTGAFVEAFGSGDPRTGVRLVATDGHRLATIERELTSKPVMSRPAIIPRKGLGEMMKILADAEGEVRLGFVENSAVLEAAGRTLTMRLVDGLFPDYKQVLPQKHSRTAKVDRAELTAALREYAPTCGASPCASLATWVARDRDPWGYDPPSRRCDAHQGHIARRDQAPCADVLRTLNGDTAPHGGR